MRVGATALEHMWFDAVGRVVGDYPMGWGPNGPSQKTRYVTGRGVEPSASGQQRGRRRATPV